MRPIKFRAKATAHYETSTDGIEKGDWVYGYYYFCRMRGSGIIVTTLGAESGGVGCGFVTVEVEIDCKTLGQFTGLLDKNSEEIYESDIVRSLDDEYDHSSFEMRFHVVQFSEGSFLPVSERHTSCFEVIGNIYKNPELLT